MVAYITNAEVKDLPLGSMWIPLPSLIDLTMIPYIVSSEITIIHLELSPDIPYGVIKNLSHTCKIYPTRDSWKNPENFAPLGELIPQHRAEIKHHAFTDANYAQYVESLLREEGLLDG